MKKSDVNGDNELPLYTYLKSKQGFKTFGGSRLGRMMADMCYNLDPDFAKKSDIKWNFTKFVVDRKGNVVARFEPTNEMTEVENCIKSLL